MRKAEKGREMLYLKEANAQDIEQEYDFITHTPAEENGFVNPASGCSREEFERVILPGWLDAAKGIGLPDGWVPDTRFFLWEDDRIVGMFKVRHFLTPALAAGAGHIGYGIRGECRGRGYATAGLKLALDKARQIIQEDEIYMSAHKSNPASLRVQLKNGAYIHHEDEAAYYTRVKH
jgi:predicted acetyltransferase